jgi:peptide/nickel transport system permease protein
MRNFPWSGTILLTLMLLAALLGPLLWPQDPLKQNYALRYATPSLEHPLGTDGLGRDVVARVLLGGRVSLGIALSATAIALLLGMTTGLLAGGRGSVLDIILTRLSDPLLAFPGFLLVLLVVVILGNGATQTVLALALGGTPTFFRLARRYTRSILGSEYVTSAVALGATRRRILPRHVLPNLFGPLLVQAASVAAAFLLVEASLSFLGLGVPPPTPTWGSVLQDARSFLLRQPWAALGPGLVLGATALGLQLVSDGLRDRFDPRFR